MTQTWWQGFARQAGISWRVLPLVPGLVVFAVGAVLDLWFHIAAATLPALLASWAGEDGESAHLLLFGGMLLIVLGLPVVAVRAAASRRA